MALFASLGLLNPRITALILLARDPLSTPTLRRLLAKLGFWLVIASSLLLAITLLIVPFGNPKTIISRVFSLVLAIALNVASSIPCSCQALLAFVLLNVSINALLRSFLAPVIRLSPPS